MKPVVCWLLTVSALAPGLAAAQTNPGPGELAPPPAVEASGIQPTPAGTEQELERAEREDSGRGLTFLWLNGEVGYELVGLHTFHADDLVDSDLVESTENGPVFGVGIGARLIYLTAGARFRFGAFQNWKMWTLNAEVGLRIPIGALEPYFTLGGGYASVGGFDANGVGGSSNNPEIRGFDVRGGVGIDYFVGGTLSVGANLSGDVLFLTRSRVSGTTPGAPGADVYGKDGSGVGGGAMLMAVAGLHF